MIILQNSLTQLEYDPSTDILYLDWPDTSLFTLEEVKGTLQDTVKAIKDYDIKKLFMDSSQREMNFYDAEFLEVMQEIAYSLLDTRLAKIARITTTDHYREQKVQEAQARAGIHLQVRSFADKETALEWLKDA
ncbi:hypothetical protein [Rufibacter radiotolerans]|nr:hypothetical protein [Rufibacter radiotolerans]